MTTSISEPSLHERATRKAMVRLLPILGIAYFMSYVDRTNVALAKTALEADVGISAAAYGLGAGLFFLTYALFEVPSNMVLYRIGARVWIGRIAVSWGAVTAAMMFVQGPYSFYFLRLLLGATEAGLYPALMYTVTLWFAQKHRVTVVGLIYLAPCLGMLLGGPMGGALMLLDGTADLRGWQWMFLVEGLITIAIGIVVWIVLPSRPRDARWLSPEEAAELTRRAVGDGTGTAHRLRGNLKLAFGRPFVLVLSVIYLLNQVAMTSIGFNVPAIVEGFGIDQPFVIGVLAGSGGLAGLFGVLTLPWIRRRYGREITLIGACAAGSALSVAAFLVSDDPAWRIGTVFVAFFFMFGTLPLFWSVAMSRMSGLMAAVGLAFINTIGLIGGFLGPYMFGLVETAAGNNEQPFVVITAVCVVWLALVPLLARTVRNDDAGAATGTAADPADPADRA